MRRKGILEFAKRCLNDFSYNKKISNNKKVLSLMEKLRSDLHNHYGFADLEKPGSCNQLRFFLFYIDKSNMTFERIAEETFLEIDTVKYYARFYNKVALRFITRESHANPHFALLLNEYQKSGL